MTTDPPFLIDLAEMPGFNPVVGSHGLHSVSEDRVFVHPHDKVRCREHGAMNAVNPERTIWRCLTCGVGAYRLLDMGVAEVRLPLGKGSKKL